MRKIIQTVSILILAVSSGFSQFVVHNTVFIKTDNVVNFDIGMGDPKYMGLGYKTNVPPLSFSFEHCVTDQILNVASIGVGGYFAYTSHQWGNQVKGSGYSWHIYDPVFGSRGTFHYQLYDNLDTYGGIMVGIDIKSDNYNSTTIGTKCKLGTELITAVFVGGRYYLTNKFAGNVELSTGIAIISIGASFKL